MTNLFEQNLKKYMKLKLIQNMVVVGLNRILCEEIPAKASWYPHRYSQIQVATAPWWVSESCVRFWGGGVKGILGGGDPVGVWLSTIDRRI